MSGSDSESTMSRKPRTIVLCFDGTAGHYDATNSNVVKLFSLFQKDTNEQLAYYQASLLAECEVAGVGTYFSPGTVSPLFMWFAKLMDEAFAWYLDAHVMQGYQYLMNNYREGDKICLFGFSRGAYTARALAGMLNKVGLIPRFNIQQQTFSRDVRVDFVGVWDTVQSTGILMNRSLPFTDSNTSIRTFRQALALDEHRAKFRPNLYHRLDPDKVNAGLDPEHASGSFFLKFKTKMHNKVGTLKSKSGKKGPKCDRKKCSSGKEQMTVTINDERACIRTEDDILTRDDIIIRVVEEEAPTAPTPPAATDVLEVWFSGCHTDIGGGAVQDDVKTSLSHITLQWMVEQIVASQCGILFDNDALERNGPTPSPELSDALAQMHDELQMQKLWWLLEIIPLDFAWQGPDGLWHKTWSIHLGRGRYIPDPIPKFHYTVKDRMDDKTLNYKPRAVYENGKECFVG
ncbi:hypothetical protein SERLA73DRAFT_169524 [Serpula lacrymans var. lacrymans S7.3]|uniref:T6SS Phospholipase effector Tle1-like catalytic domain-containing protein n=1 Tax=Serpula lacrymans var. lacrymans (strain S7.3) TaxID=936435 RepID=F8Q0D7_SERL3|nr:hypothetical protein SERLA73DRAFT_169524 [Serpula lacrymans var. lacrymans S7.3]